MDLDRYISTHRDDWQQLQELTRTAEGKPGSLSDDEIDEFVLLYQRASGHLAYARDYYNDSALNAELYTLISAANSALYQRTSSPGQGIRRFFLIAFPAAVWNIRRGIVLAFLALAIPAAVMALWLSNSPEALDIVSSEAQRAAYVEEDFENYYSSGPASEFATNLLINNIQVSFLAYALGIFFCVGSLYILAMNGALFGGALAVFIVAGQQARFWGLVTPHGLLELSAAIIAGAAGMTMGWAIIDPGDRTRAQAFAEEAKRSVTVIMGLMLAFIVAAIIEAFITPSGFPTAVRVGIGFAIWATFVGYVVSFGRVAAGHGFSGLLEEESEGETAAIAISV